MLYAIAIGPITISLFLSIVDPQAVVVKFWFMCEILSVLRASR